MKRFIEGESRVQVTLLPECLDDYIGEDNPVRIVDAFVDKFDNQFKTHPPKRVNSSGLGAQAWSTAQRQNGTMPQP